MKRPLQNLLVILLFALLLLPDIQAQDSNYRPGLFFREDWKETPAEIPVSQSHVSNPDLILTLYGAGKDSLKKSNHEKPVDDPYYIWSGLCTGTWAVTLRHNDFFANLSGYSKIRWRSKQAGLRELHILLKLTDGTWLVSKQGDPASADWRIREFNLKDLEWYAIDMITITEQKQVIDPDLSMVDEIGFTDLMPGGKSVACSRLDWLEVYGYLVPIKKE